jgi:XTP/dITP diphosphohydrolase
MSRQLLLGTFNANKAKEVQAALGTDWQVLTCKDFPLVDEVEETGTTLEANAQLKAEAYARATGLPCLADDTGLEVDALDGAPGVYSARYAGDQATAGMNTLKLLKDLIGKTRRARFRTVMAWAVPGQVTQFFTGVLEGEITLSPRGEQGFGYDPVFQPVGDSRTLAEMELAEKNAISHRGRALRAFVEGLRAQK